ncbi:MAG: hypothetical protein IT445_00975 [Phycisphaeraceae bacterium]|nr:hypothetical protein [Phycisphaeraceae bacterium]
MTGLTIRTVCRALADLEKMGIIYRDRSPGGRNRQGRGYTTNYIIPESDDLLNTDAPATVTPPEQQGLVAPATVTLHATNTDAPDISTLTHDAIYSDMAVSEKCCMNALENASANAAANATAPPPNRAATAVLEELKKAGLTGRTVTELVDVASGLSAAEAVRLIRSADADRRDRGKGMGVLVTELRERIPRAIVEAERTAKRRVEAEHHAAKAATAQQQEQDADAAAWAALSADEKRAIRDRLITATKPIGRKMIESVQPGPALLRLARERGLLAEGEAA